MQFKKRQKAIEEKFLRLESTIDLVKQELQMTASIEVQTGQRTVLQYLTKPVIKTLSQSLGER